MNVTLMMPILQKKARGLGMRMPRSFLIGRCLCLFVVALAMTWCYAETTENVKRTAGHPVPQQMKLMIASFGTIDSQAEVEGWLADQLKPLQHIEQIPSVSRADTISNPALANEVAYVNWTDRKVEYIRAKDDIRAENARRARILTELKTHMLSDAAQRYTQLGRDFLQARIYKKVGKLISIIDRGNMTIQQTEKSLKGDDLASVVDADCILSVVLGDRETQSKTITMDNVGTKIKRVTLRQPYVGKIRDLKGNVLCAFDGVAEWKTSQDNVVKTEESDPTRKLVEKACDLIADEVVSYFTTELVFRIHVPEGFNPDDVEITVDGSEVDGNRARVLSFEHVIRGKLDGCVDVEKTVSGMSMNLEKTVKLNFKKRN